MLGLSANLRYFLCCSTIDIRNGLDGLAGIVRNHLKKDPVSGDVFIFLNKNPTHIKLLYWDGDGFALFYKRLDRGRYALSALRAIETDPQGRAFDASRRAFVSENEPEKTV